MISSFIKVNIIIVLTVLSYLLALLFEYGYATVFNYPFDMVSISVNSLFIAVLCTSLVVFSILSVFIGDNVTSILLIRMIKILIKRRKRNIALNEIKQLVNDAHSRLFESFKLKWLRLTDIISILLFIGLVILGFILGMIMACEKSNFYTFQFKGDKYAIIRKYDSNLITAKVTNKKLSLVVTYFTTDSLNGLALNHEEGITREGTSESKN